MISFSLIHTDKTAVTIQSNKIVLNEVKGNKAVLDPSYKKKQMNFLANPIYKTKQEVSERHVTIEDQQVICLLGWKYSVS